MKKKLIAALVIAALLLAGAVGVVVYLENRPSGNPDPGKETTVAPVDPSDNTDMSAPAETAEPTEAEEETIGLTFPTENPDEVMPAETFSEEDEVPPVSVDPNAPQETEDRESNETPPDVF